MIPESSGYEATLDQDYADLTETHTRKRTRIEKEIDTFLKTKKGKPVTIQGPYGTGKTQLLYHLFKRTIKKGNLAIYTHLEKLIPNQNMGPEKYADYLEKVLLDEKRLLKEGKSMLLSQPLMDFVIENDCGFLSDDSRIVLLIDEIEQSYNLLDEKIRSDDHSPMRETIARVLKGTSRFFLILAFAPTSYYEFNKGEAQSRRLLPITLPILEARNSRRVYGRLGNLSWWMARGRFGIINRVIDYLTNNIENADSITKKEIMELNKSLGTIGGSRIFENIELLSSIEDFHFFRRFLINVFPLREGNELMVRGGGKLITRCNIINMNKDEFIQSIENVLRELGTQNQVQVADYIGLVFDGLREDESHFPMFLDQNTIEEIIDIAEEIILDFEGEQAVPYEGLRQVKGDIATFTVKLYSETRSKETEKAYVLDPSFIHSLFPFPTSSPNLNPDIKIEMQRETLGDHTYLGKTRVGDVEVVFFLNSIKMNEFLERRIGDYLNESKSLMALILENKTTAKLSEVPAWLREQGRLKVTHTTESLSDFLTSLFYWIKQKKDRELPLEGVLETLKTGDLTSEKNVLRRLQNYTNKTYEFIKSELPISSPKKFELRDKTDFDQVKTGRIGFSSEIMGFAFASKDDDLQLFNSLKEQLGKSNFIRSVLTEKKTGIATAIETMVVKRKVVSLGAILKRVSESFDGQSIESLRLLAHHVTQEQFASIPSDRDLEVIFNGLFLYLNKWDDNSDAEAQLAKAKKSLTEIIDRIGSLETDISDFHTKSNNTLELIFALSADKNLLLEISSALSKYRNKVSPYSKFLFSMFIEKICETIEPSMSGYEKRKAEFVMGTATTIDRFNEAIKSVEDFDSNTFEMIGISKGNVTSEYIEKFKEACKQISVTGKVDLSSQIDFGGFIEEVEMLSEELAQLYEVDEKIRKMKVIAGETNEMLNKFR